MTDAMATPTPFELLARALTLLRSPLPHTWAACNSGTGNYCVRCAVSAAADLFSDERHLRFYDTDESILGAVELLRRHVGTVPVALTEAEACLAVKKAMADAEN